MNALRTRVKMCGMTRKEDIEFAISIGVDAIGLIFYEKSPRNVTIKKAKDLIQGVQPFVSAVAVLVNPTKVLVQEITDELPVDILQFHGDESPEFCQQFNKPFIKAMQPKNASQINQYAQDFSHAQALLLDTPSTTNRGGTGLTFDWTIIPKHLSKPFILAGGLNELNVKEALQACNPYAVDVCSGVEESPGIKNHSKMSRFIKALWGAQ